MGTGGNVDEITCYRKLYGDLVFVVPHYQSKITTGFSAPAGWIEDYNPKPIGKSIAYENGQRLCECGHTLCIHWHGVILSAESQEPCKLCECKMFKDVKGATHEI